MKSKMRRLAVCSSVLCVCFFREDVLKKVESVSALHYRRSTRLGDSKNKATMASSKDDGTAAVSEQLGTMSLGKSAERKDNETEPIFL